MRSLAVLPLLALGACAAIPGAALVHSAIVDPSYMPEQVSAVGPVMPLEMRGAPPGGGTAAAVAEVMHLPPRFGGQPLEPVGAPTQGPRIALVFAPSGRRDVCAPDAVRGGPSEGRLHAVIAYCYGRSEMSSAIVEGPATGPGDPAFAAAMRQAVAVLLPARNPAFDSDRDGGGRWRP